MVTPAQHFGKRTNCCSHFQNEKRDNRTVALLKNFIHLLSRAPVVMSADVFRERLLCMSREKDVVLCIGVLGRMYQEPGRVTVTDE